MASLAELQFQSSKHVDLLATRWISDSGESDGVGGFAEAVAINVGASIALLAAGQTLTLKVQHSDDDGDQDAYTDLHTYTITVRGKTAIVRKEAPKAFLRATWSIAGSGTKRAYITYLSITEGGGLPDAAEADAGDVLTLDSDLNPVWAPPAP